MAFLSKILGLIDPLKQVGNVVDKFITTPDEKKKFMLEMESMLHKADMQAFEAEVKDRDSARQREVEMAKAGKTDWLMYAVGILVLGSFVLVVYAALFMEIQNENIFYFIAGAVVGVMTSVVGYYFGSSKGSKDKQGVIDQVQKNLG